MSLWKHFALPASLAVAMLIVGCESNKDQDRSRDSDARTSRERIGRDRIPSDIPSDAKDVAHTTAPGDRLDYKAISDGKLYIYDVDADRVVGTTRIRSGERFSMNPDNGRVSIEGDRVTLDRDPSPRDRYKLYFVEGSNRDSSRSDRNYDNR